MIIEALRPEMDLNSLLILAPILIGYISMRQREWLQRVWHNKCQGRNAGMVHNCTEKRGVQFHHIESQSYSYEFLNLTEDVVDRPTNLIPLCSNAHVGSDGQEDCIHPDQREAQISFQSGNHDVYKKLQDRRMLMAQSGEPYWNQKYDPRFEILVQFKIERYQRNNKSDTYPIKNHRNGNGNRNGH